MVKVEIENFQLAPRHFGGEPQLGEGNIRFSLNRVPDCVDPVKLQKARSNSPIGNGRLVGASFDFPEYAGPNGVLAERIGTDRQLLAGDPAGDLLPRPAARLLPPVVTLAQNNGSTTPYHAVTNFQILPEPGHGAEVRRRQGPQRQGRRGRHAVDSHASAGQYFTLYSGCDADLPPFDGLSAPLPPPALGLAGLRLGGDGDDGADPVADRPRGQRDRGRRQARPAAAGAGDRRRRRSCAWG